MARYANDKIIDLHSNMVRFIICRLYIFFYHYLFIYIPIWLDLLCLLSSSVDTEHRDLHSNMVRFIIIKQSGGENVRK